MNTEEHGSLATDKHGFVSVGSMTLDRLRKALDRGLVIPAHPLALDESGRFDERHQRALTRYYAAAGAGAVSYTHLTLPTIYSV